MLLEQLEELWQLTSATGDGEPGSHLRQSSKPNQ